MNPEIPTNCLPAELVARPGFLLGRLGIALKTQTMGEFEREGFNPYQYSVLALLDEGARETQATIASALDLDPSRLVAVLDSLENRGLVSRQRDPQDRRRHVVSITADGKRELQRLRAIAKELEDEFFGTLAREDRDTLHRLLSELACAHDPRCAFAPTVSSKPD